MTTLPTQPEPLTQRYFEIRDSGIHGKGAFAIRPIRKGTRLIEYTGERISNAEADRRAAILNNESHTVLFTLTSRTIVDAGVGGNESRFINHSCEPNCEATIEDGRIFIEALRGIKVGQELTYDYQLVTTGRPTKAERAKYACRCGSPNCRGTMIAYEPPRPRKKLLKK